MVEDGASFAPVQSNISSSQTAIGSDVEMEDVSNDVSSISETEDDSFADEIIDMIDHEEYVCFNIENHNDDLSQGDDSVVSIALITNLISLHHTLVVDLPIIAEIVGEGYGLAGGYERNYEYCQFEVSKVGKITGDICVKITGEHSHAIKHSRKLIQFNDKTQKYQQTVAVTKDQLIDDLYSKSDSPNVQISRSISTGSVSPWYLISIEGDSSEILSNLIASRYTYNTGKGLNIKCPFNHPPNKPFDVIHQSPVIESPRPEASTSTKTALKDITNTTNATNYVHIRLTRKEVTYIIGKGGSKIENLRKTSKATIKVIPLNSLMNDDTLMDKTVLQFIRISGTSQQIKLAKRLIDNEIYQFRLGGITSYQ